MLLSERFEIPSAHVAQPIAQPQLPAHARRLRDARKRARLTQLQLAMQAGVSLPLVYLAERGGVISDRTALRFATVLGAKPEDFRRPRPAKPSP